MKWRGPPRPTAILIYAIGGGAAGSSNCSLNFTSTKGKEDLNAPSFSALGRDSISIEWISNLELRVHYSKCATRQFKNDWIDSDARPVEVFLARDINLNAGQ